MIEIALGKKPPFAPFQQEGAKLHLASDDHENLRATILYSARDLTSTEINSLRTGKTRIAITPIKIDGYVLPIFVVKNDQGYFECPYALGLEAPTDQRRIANALANVNSLTHEETWLLTIISTEMRTNEVVGIRFSSLTSRFWRIAADAILASRSVSQDVQDRMLQIAYAKCPRSKDLFKRALHTEILGTKGTR